MVGPKSSAQMSELVCKAAIPGKSAARGGASQVLAWMSELLCTDAAPFAEGLAVIAAVVNVGVGAADECLWPPGAVRRR